MITMISPDEAKRALRSNLREILDEKGWSVYQLVKESGLPAQPIYRAARGESVPDSVILLALAKFLKISVENLLDTN